MIRNKILMLCILIFANVSAFADSCPCFFSNQIGLLIPFYIYPTSSYAQVLINTRKQYPAHHDIDNDRHGVTSFSLAAMVVATVAAGTRYCTRESRSRMVTVSSVRVWLSTVTQ